MDEHLKKAIEIFDKLHKEERQQLWNLLYKKGKISEEDWKRLTADPDEEWVLKEK